MGAEAKAAPAPGPGELFAAFLAVALSGFGGVLPFARRTLVERRGWLTAAEFNETLALCQSIPGPNIVNLSVVVGSRYAGIAGAGAALAGLILAPMAIVAAAGLAWARFSDLPWLAEAVAGLGAAAAGLVVATATRMAAPLLAARPLFALPVIAAAFVGAGLMHLPLWQVVAVLAPPSVFFAWKRDPS